MEVFLLIIIIIIIFSLNSGLKHDIETLSQQLRDLAWRIEERDRNHEKTAPPQSQNNPDFVPQYEAKPVPVVVPKPIIQIVETPPPPVLDVEESPIIEAPKRVEVVENQIITY